AATRVETESIPVSPNPAPRHSPSPPLASSPPVIPAAAVFAPPPAGQFSASAQALLEREKMRRQLELFADDSRWQTAWHDLAARGLEAVPVLLEALERREVKVCHLAFRLLEQITGESLTYTSDAPYDVRLRQVAFLRAKLERRKSA